MKKKGQVMGTPFIMIFALVVGALTMLGGLYYVYHLTKFAGEVSITKEVNDFKTAIKSYYYLEEGNSKTMKISLPTQAKNICFYDSEKHWNPAARVKDYPVDFPTKEQFYKKFFQSFKTKNMFIIPIEEFKESAFEIKHLNLETQSYNPVCIRNRQEFRIISMGDHVEITYTS